MEGVSEKIFYFENHEVEGITLPEKFTFPFYYQPHPLAALATQKLQQYLLTQSDFNHNFGLNGNIDGIPIGKMFGVLIIKDKEGRLGYLWGFSGKLAGTNEHKHFVSPVFDMLTENSFFLEEEEILNALNSEIENLENSDPYKKLSSEIKLLTEKSTSEIALLKAQLKENKLQRSRMREANKTLLNEHDFAQLNADLVKQSLADKRRLKSLSEHWQQLIEAKSKELRDFDDILNTVRKKRKEKSSALQDQLFSQYKFLNKNKQEKSLKAIFSETVFGKPPAAAGECATPKLLQYAFSHNLKPLAMAEFWWGASPKSEIRKHKHYYPACTGKCQPILKHMLEGVATDKNPLLENAGASEDMEIVFEDDYLIVVNKPAELLSVPGIHIKDSVYLRLKNRFTTIEPLIIHRLDMATSGLLVVAKTKEAHKHIQRQFLKRTVKKKYTALLSEVIAKDDGEINLPLRGDIDDRPRQMVCNEFGKPAITRWAVIERFKTTTKVHFWPLTGRTHQLRMHASHPLGLNAPIVGDDLYGTAANRLHLHAASLEFIHPKTKEKMYFNVPESF